MPRPVDDDLQPLEPHIALVPRVRRQFARHVLEMSFVLTPGLLAMEAPRLLELFRNGTPSEFLRAQFGFLVLQAFSIAAGLRTSHVPLQDSSIAVSIGRLATVSYALGFVSLLWLPLGLDLFGKLTFTAALALALAFVIYTVTTPIVLWRRLTKLDGRPLSVADTTAFNRYLRPWPNGDRSIRRWLRAPLVHAGEAIGFWIVAETIGSFVFELPLTVWAAFGVPALWLVVRVWQLIRQS
jgi:hypothetical protein